MSLCTSKVSTVIAFVHCISTCALYSIYSILISLMTHDSLVSTYSTVAVQGTKYKCTCTTVDEATSKFTVLHYSILNFKGNMTSDFRERERVNIDSIEY